MLYGTSEETEEMSIIDEKENLKQVEIISSIEHQVGKGLSRISIFERDCRPRADTVKWAYDENNPDYKLVIISAANPGFQSKVDTEKGSFMITKFTEKLRDNVVNAHNEKFLQEIIDEIQEELHDVMGTQLITSTCNNKPDRLSLWLMTEIELQRAVTVGKLESFPIAAEYVDVEEDQKEEIIQIEMGAEVAD